MLIYSLLRCEIARSVNIDLYTFEEFPTFNLIDGEQSRFFSDSCDTIRVLLLPCLVQGSVFHCILALFKSGIYYLPPVWDILLPL